MSVPSLCMDENTFLLVLVLALLVCNSAGSLASRLAGSLALAAAALSSSFLKSAGVQSLDVSHDIISFHILIVSGKNKFCRHVSVKKNRLTTS